MRQEEPDSRRPRPRTWALLTVMGLPLVDGVFATLLLAGGLDTLAEATTVGIFVFGGSAALTVVLSRFTGPTRDELKRVAGVGIVLATGVVIESILAPTIASVLDTELFRYAAVGVIVVVAGRIYGGSIGKLLPNPSVVLIVGLLASFRPHQFEFGVVTDPTAIVYGLAAIGVAIAFVATGVLFRGLIHRSIDMSRFRVGSAAALAILGLSLLGFVPSTVSWMALGGTIALSVKTV